MTKVKTTDFGALLSSVPVNVTAALVTQKSKEDDEARLFELHECYSETPLPMLAFNEMNKQHVDVARQLIGIRIGRLIVIGAAKEKAKNAGSLWVVRCDCGAYSMRKARAIKNPKNKNDMCAHCRKIPRALYLYGRGN